MVDAAKYIRVFPSIPKPSPNQNIIRLQADVYRRADGNVPYPGLIVIAKLRLAPPGLPKRHPSATLEWHGLRIRGVDYEVQHDNPDGSIVEGWHEHLWSSQYKDAYVIPARPNPTRKALRDILLWGLQKWNIEVIEGMQMEAEL